MKLFVVVLCVSVCYCVNSDITTNVEIEHVEITDIKSSCQPKDVSGDGIIRPCPTSDTSCIRCFFAQNSYCTPAYGPPPDPYPIATLAMPIPNANLTFIWNNAQAKGLKDAVITEFYINNATNKLVLEIEVPAIAVFSPGSIARFHRKGREPIELTDYSFITYRMVSLTLVVPFDKGIQMDRADMYTYLGAPRPSTNIGAGLSNTDPEIQRSFNSMIDNISISMREAFIVQAPVHMSVFIESSICSFRGDNPTV